MKKKIWIFVIFGVPLFSAGLFAVTIYWVLHSPSALKPAFELGFSRLTHAPVRIEKLVISRQPHYGINLYGVHLALDSEKSENYFEAEEAAIQLSLAGPMGKKVLWIEMLRFERPVIKLEADNKWPEWEASSPSRFSADFLKKLFTKLFFQEVRFRSFAVSNGGVEYQSESRHLSVSDLNLHHQQSFNLIADGVVSIIDKQHDLFLPELFFDGNLHYTSSDPTDAEIAGEVFLMLDRVCIKEAELSEVQGLTGLHYDKNARKVSISSLKLQSIAEVLPANAVKPLLPQAVSLELKGEIELPEEKLNLIQWHLAAGQLIEMQGTASACWKAPIQATVAAKEGWLDLQRIQPLIMEQNTDADFRLFLKDKVGVLGQTTLYTDNNQYRLASALTIGLHNNHFVFQQKKAAVQGYLGGSIRLNSTWPGSYEFEGHLDGRAMKIATASLNIDHLAMGGHFKGRYPEIRLKELWCDLPAIDFQTQGKPVELKNLKISAEEALWNLNSSVGQLPRMQITSDLLKNMALNINHAPSSTKISVSADDSGLLTAIEKLNLLPEGWRFEGRETLQADVVFDADSQVVKWQVGCDLKKLTLENQDQSIISEK